MKLTRIVLASIASPLALVSAQSAPSNASAPSMVAPSNSLHEGAARKCSTLGGLAGWYYDSWSSGPYSCYGPQGKEWIMRSAYRSGGTENLHWKYTDDPNDPKFPHWKWYAEDGERLITEIRGSTSLEGATGRLWCALPVYRSGGVRNKQWHWCNCW